jgi:hypothetical protein
MMSLNMLSQCVREMDGGELEITGYKYIKPGFWAESRMKTKCIRGTTGKTGLASTMLSNFDLDYLGWIGLRCETHREGLDVFVAMRDWLRAKMNEMNGLVELEHKRMARATVQYWLFNGTLDLHRTTQL